MRTIKIFDTTLRDGEQSPGCSMNIKEKIEVAKQLEKLNVDVIEAGFAIASKGDFEAIREISKNVKKPIVASLSRALKKDIDIAYEAIKYANKKRIHTFIATSDIHMEYKLKMDKKEVLKHAVDMVKYAKKLCYDIEFSAEDASRTNKEFLYEILYEVIKAGATTVNIPDTVGYITPEEYYHLIKGIRDNVSNIKNADISVHCHNDLGMAVSNSLAALRAGANQIECTINGIGERAGNAALEEVVMAMDVRKDIYVSKTNINKKEIIKSSNLISTITGSFVSANKAIVGENAFAHESGIHQHGVLENKETYEIMTPESIGKKENKIVFGKHSGKHAFINKLEELGYNFDEFRINELFNQMKDLCDKKKNIYESDIEVLIAKNLKLNQSGYKLKSFVINTGNITNSTSTIKLISEGNLLEEVSLGDGPIDASFKAIDKIIGVSFILKDYKINSLSKGKDALGEVSLILKRDNKKYRGIGMSTDIIEASILAYLDSVNKYMILKELDNNENEYDAKNISK